MSDWVWAGLFAAGLAYEAWTIRTAGRGDTLSETIRRVFRVHTRPGKLVFLVLWLGFAGWFAWHIAG